MAQRPGVHQGVGTQVGAECFGIWGPLCGLLMAPKHNMCIISWDSRGFDACYPLLSSGEGLEGLKFALLHGGNGRGAVRRLAGVCGVFPPTLL